MVMLDYSNELHLWEHGESAMHSWGGRNERTILKCVKYQMYYSALYNNKAALPQVVNVVHSRRLNVPHHSFIHFYCIQGAPCLSHDALPGPTCHLSIQYPIISGCTLRNFYLFIHSCNQFPAVSTFVVVSCKWASQPSSHPTRCEAKGYTGFRYHDNRVEAEASARHQSHIPNTHAVPT